MGVEILAEEPQDHPNSLSNQDAKILTEAARGTDSERTMLKAFVGVL
jgi:hypothetical protein